MKGTSVLVKSVLVMLAATILVRNFAAAQPHALASAIAAKKARQPRYLNSWALEIRDGSDTTADALALKHGLVNRGQVRCINRIITCVRVLLRFVSFTCRLEI